MSITANHPIVETLCDRFYASGSLDYVGFWEIYYEIKPEGKPNGKEEHRELILAVIRCLLKKGMRPFNFVNSSSEKVAWKYKDDNEVLERVASLWDDLREEPGLGSICWFMRIG